MVRTIGGEIINGLFTSRVYSLCQSSMRGPASYLHCLLDHFFSHYLLPVCSTAVRLRGHIERISELTITTMQEISMNSQQGGECLVIHTNEVRSSSLCWSSINKKASNPAKFAE